MAEQNFWVDVLVTPNAHHPKAQNSGGAGGPDGHGHAGSRAHLGLLAFESGVPAQEAQGGCCGSAGGPEGGAWHGSAVAAPPRGGGGGGSGRMDKEGRGGGGRPMLSLVIAMELSDQGVREGRGGERVCTARA